MEQSFWTNRWKEGKTGWHSGEVNAFLMQSLERLQCEAGDPVLVPLCGKTLDLAWLASEAGLRPVGVEWAEQAAIDFFAEHGLSPSQQQLAPEVAAWSAGGVEILCADWFEVTAEQLAQVGRSEVRAWWDRASLIALPAELRVRYVEHLASLLPSGARGLLLSLEYPHGELNGPPFSVEAPEVHRLFEEAFTVEELAWRDALPESPKRQQQGVTRLHERLYSLQRR